MLSFAKCREVLGAGSSESDADLELLRDQLYALARATVEAFPHQRCKNDSLHALNDARHAFNIKTVEIPTTSFPDALELLSEEDRYAVKERAAILEFDGGLSRDAAEQAALLLYRQNKNARN
jgi:hypothetical protein